MVRKIKVNIVDEVFEKDIKKVPLVNPLSKFFKDKAIEMGLEEINKIRNNSGRRRMLKVYYKEFPKTLEV